MKTFTESDRYDIAGLTPASIVVDVGSYEGNWGRQICERYGCWTYFLEPIAEFRAQIQLNLLDHPRRDRMTFFDFGLGGYTREETMGVCGDSTGLVSNGPVEKVRLVGVGDLLNNSLFFDKQIAVAKLNCEGAEFEILEAMLEQNLMGRVDIIHVQFHDIIPRASARMAYIKNMMLMTHRPIFDSGWTWCGWELR